MSISDLRVLNRTYV